MAALAKEGITEVTVEGLKQPKETLSEHERPLTDEDDVLLKLAAPAVATVCITSRRSTVKCDEPFLCHLLGEALSVALDSL